MSTTTAEDRREADKETASRWAKKDETWKEKQARALTKERREKDQATRGQEAARDQEAHGNE